MPAQLLGDWFLPEEAALALNPPATGGPPCPHPLSAVTCFARLTFTATTYRFYYGTTEVGPGEVVVNNNEIDFYNASVCSRQLPDGVGRYNWTLTGGLLSFALVGQDPCNRSNELTYQSWSRTH